MIKKSGLMGRVQFGTDETVKNSIPEDLSARGPKTPQAKELQAHQKVRVLEAELAVNLRGIPLDVIDTEEGRKRKLKEEDYQDLKNNILKAGLIHKIIVRKKDNGRYEVIAGHNRLQIFRELLEAYPEDERFKNIPADLQTMEDGAVHKKAFYSNLFNSPLSDFEKYLGFKKIQQDTKETQEQLAEGAGVSQPQITRIFAFERFPQKAIEVLDKNPHLLGATAAQKLSTASAERILLALEKLLTKECNETQAIAFALANTEKKPTRQEPIIIRSGRKTFAEIKVKKGLLAIMLKDVSNEQIVLDRIQKVLEELSKN